MVNIAFNRFYKHTELSEVLHEFVKAYPKLASIESIGKSYEGRELWVVTVTNQETGPAADKPAFWIDANIHATELAGSTAVLYQLNHLLTHYGIDAEISHLLDTRAFYLCPRVNPDGAEWAMADKPKFIRSSTRPYPYDEPAPEGLVPEDIDGDGRILMMRIKDANGQWKKHEDEPRLLVRREPTEFGGEYYRVVPEGRYPGYDGLNLNVSKVREGLDLNRNFPVGWRQEYQQVGAGDFPTSEPEVRACVQFLTSHRNICGGIFFHTWSGVLLRPFDDKPDSDMSPEDLWVYQMIGKEGQLCTGYPAISVYHEFRYHPKQVITGTQDWLFSEQGCFSWVVEIWCPMREAGISGYQYIDWFRDHPVTDDLKLLKWSDEALHGKGYVDWYAYDHPDLGQVELGGWDRFYAFSNPAPHLLEKEVAKFPKWLNYQALLSPKLSVHSTHVTALSEDTWQIKLCVENQGYLPTYVSENALTRKLSRGVIAHLSGDISFVQGKSRQEGPELKGRSHIHTSASFWPATTATPDRHVFEWVVVGKAGSICDLVAEHDKAGRVRVQMTLI
ncbi:MAG: hypothetical protein RLZZ502_34 [Pseudomonadota bacterium]|jgi:murein tripeptide amidase MpaA